MKKIIFAAVIAAAASSTAFAQTETRMSDSTFIAASACIAYSDHRALEDDVFNVDLLRRAVADNRGHIHSYAQSRAAEGVREARSTSARTEARVQELRARRDATCAPFITQGLVQTAPSVSAS